MTGNEAPLRVEVVTGSRERQRSVWVSLPAGATVADAVRASGLGVSGAPAFAVYGTRVSADTVLETGDRVEILRPLTVDPREARRRRAALRR